MFIYGSQIKVRKPALGISRKLQVQVPLRCIFGMKMVPIHTYLVFSMLTSLFVALVTQAIKVDYP